MYIKTERLKEEKDTSSPSNKKPNIVTHKSAECNHNNAHWVPSTIYSNQISNNTFAHWVPSTIYPNQISNNTLVFLTHSNSYQCIILHSARSKTWICMQLTSSQVCEPNETKENAYKSVISNLPYHINEKSQQNYIFMDKITTSPQNNVRIVFARNII